MVTWAPRSRDRSTITVWVRASNVTEALSDRRIPDAAECYWRSARLFRMLPDPQEITAAHVDGEEVEP